MPLIVVFLPVLALFAAGYLVAVYVLFPPPPVPEDGIQVPDLSGLTVASAADRLRPAGLALGDTVRLPHATVGPGLVVAQDPMPGQQSRNGGQVHLGVSSGLPAATVPDVAGLAARRAQNLLTRLGFDVSQTLEPSRSPNGTVIRTVPESGVRQPLPARVVMIVSSGQLDTLRVDTVPRDTIR